MKWRIAAILFLAPSLLAIGCVWFWMQPSLTVENRSGQSIAYLKVSISGETILFENIANGRNVTSAFRIAADDHFVVEGRLADGTDLKGEFGYVTSGTFADRAYFTIHENGRIDTRQWDGLQMIAF